MKERFTLIMLTAFAVLASYAQPANLVFTPWPDRTLTFESTEGDFLGTKNSLLTGVNAANYDEATVGLNATNLVNVEDPDDQLVMALVWQPNGNDLSVFTPISVDGQEIEHTETQGYGNRPIGTIAGEREYIYIDNYGTAEDFAKVKDVLAGKIAVCNRGTIPFVDKANAAVANGAIAVIVVNHQEGTVNMSLMGYEYDKPAVCATMAGGELLKSKATYVDGDAPYYKGTLTISDETVYEHRTQDFVFGDADYYPDYEVRAVVYDLENATPGATYQATITYLGGTYYEYNADDDEYIEWPIEMSELTDNPTTTLTLVVPSTTGIEEVTAKDNADSPAFNLLGLPVGKDYKGIVIKNGKKVLR